MHSRPDEPLLETQLQMEEWGLHQRLDWAITITQNMTSGHRAFCRDMLQSWCIVVASNHPANFDKRLAGIQA